MSASSDIASVRRAVTLPDDVDLHARPAGSLVRLAATQPAVVTLHSNGRHAAAGSILQVLALGATRGSTLELEATGPGASESVDAIAGLLEQLA